MRIQPSVWAGVALLVLLAGWMPGAVANAQEQQQQQPAFGAPANQPTPEEENAIRQIYTTGDPDQKLALVKEFIEKYPDSQYTGLAYRAAAEAYRRQAKFAQVVEYGEKAIEFSQGRDAIAYLVVADALAESALPIHADAKEKLAKAEEYALRALQILPEMAAGRQRREGVSEEEYKRQHGMVEGLGHAILGNVYFRRQEHAKAVEELTKAIATDGYQPDGVDFQRLGFAHLRQQQLKEAEAAFQQCVERGGSAGAECQKRVEYVREQLAAQEKPQP